MKNSRGKPAKANISFEFVEYSWFDLFETGRRRFSEIGYIMPKNIGTAKAVFSGLVEEKERKEKRTVCETPVAEVNYVSWSGRKRGKKSGLCLLATDPGGWLIETNSAKYTYKFIKKHKGCNGRRSSATWEKNSPTAVSVKTTVVTHKGRNSTCSAKTTVNFWQWRPTSRNVRRNTSVQKITTSNDIQFRLSASDSKILKRSRLIHVEVTSPLFGNGTRVIRPNESRGAFKLDFNAAAQIGYLRFAYIK